MIQEAHVGVGISGREGLQAARAADFSFGSMSFQPICFYEYNSNIYPCADKNMCACELGSTGHKCLEVPLVINRLIAAI
jgi:hypothetical protein